jgi:hypothetical protein
MTDKPEIALSGSYEIENNIFVGTVAFDPVSKLRTSVAVSSYGSADGGPSSYSISCYYDEGLTADNVRVIDARLGTPGYRSVFDGQVKILDIVLLHERSDPTLKLFIGDFLGSREVTSANQLFSHPVSSPVETYRHVLQLSLRLFETLAARQRLARVELFLPPRFAAVLGGPDGPTITRSNGQPFLLFGTSGAVA